MNILEEYIAASGLLHDTDLPQAFKIKSDKFNPEYIAGDIVIVKKANNNITVIELIRRFNHGKR